MNNGGFRGSGAVAGAAIFFGGILAGAIIGMLMAPKSGKETREMLAARAAELKDRAVDAALEARDAAMDAAERARAAAVETAKRAQAKIEAVRTA